MKIDVIKRSLSIFLFGFIVLHSADGFAFGDEKNQFVVIVNADNKVDMLSRSKISKLFLKKITEWDDGKKVVPVNHSIREKMREAFAREIHKRNISSIRAYWQKMIFSGRAVPPIERNKNSEIAKIVGEDMGAIGFVSSDFDLSKYRVKIIKIDYQD